MAKSDRAWVAEAADRDWIEATGRPVHPVLLEMEATAAPERIPILERDEARVLAVLAAGSRRIVEVGTAIGYSTLWMALAQPADGTIVTIDPDGDRTARARAYWRRAGIADDRITIVGSPALDALELGHAALRGPFDLAFIDALKPEYVGYLEALQPRLAAGALVVADNVLWSGRTSGARPSRDGDHTEALRDFCRQVLRDPAFEATILPIGDGLLVATYRS
jgi:predicted O-methyltransferase YrrM